MPSGGGGEKMKYFAGMLGGGSDGINAVKNVEYEILASLYIRPVYVLERKCRGRKCGRGTIASDEALIVL